MNRKEVNEIRRRLKPDKTNIQQLHGCYVNGQKEIISTFHESVNLLTEEEREQLLGLLKKSLSGGLGRNLICITFSTAQVMDSEEHRLLSTLRKTGLQDEEALQSFYQRVIENLNMEDSNYLILMAYDVYDIRKFHKDGTMDEDSADTFPYILCAIIPVKSTKPVMGYSEEEETFRRRSMAQILGTTELGFLFPAFDDRCANIYNALFYSKNVKELHAEFIEGVFCTQIPMSAGEKKAAFGAAVEETLGKECSFSVIRDLNEELGEMIAAHKESKDPEPLEITIEEAETLLEKSGMPEESRETFITACKERFGEEAILSPEIIIDSAHMDISTEAVKIRVSPDMRPFIKTRSVEGRKYILIPAEGQVEINGVNVTVDTEE